VVCVGAPPKSRKVFYEISNFDLLFCLVKLFQEGKYAFLIKYFENILENKNIRVVILAFVIRVLNKIIIK